MTALISRVVRVWLQGISREEAFPASSWVRELAVLAMRVEVTHAGNSPTIVGERCLARRMGARTRSEKIDRAPLVAAPEWVVKNAP